MNRLGATPCTAQYHAVRRQDPLPVRLNGPELFSVDNILFLCDNRFGGGVQTDSAIRNPKLVPGAGMKAAVVFLLVFVAVGVSLAQSLEGVVSNALTKEPVVGAVIEVEGAQLVDTTDTGGVYEFPRVDKGTYTVRVTAKDYLSRSKRVILRSPHEAGASNVKQDFPIYHHSSEASDSKGDLAVEYFFPGHGNVEIAVYDSNKTKIHKLIDRSRRGGKRVFRWDGKDAFGKTVPSGRYTIRISSGTMVMVREVFWLGGGEIIPES